MTRQPQIAGVEQLQALQRVTDAALGHLALDELLSALLDRIAELLAVDTAAILLLEGEELAARAAKGLEEEVERGFRIPLGAGFAGRIAAERRPVVLEDVRPGDVVNPLLLEKGVRSLLGVPLLVEGEAIGVLHVGSLTPRPFSEEDATLLQLVADRAALAIEHARLFESAQAARRQAEATAQQLQALQRVTDAALGHLALDELLSALLDRIAELLAVDTAAILLLEGEELAARAAKGLEEEVERGFRIPLGAGFAGRIAAERRPVVLEDVRPGDVVNPLLLEKGVRSLLGVPLLVEGEAIGVLHVGSLTPRPFSEEDATLLQLVADRAALAIEHARLYEQEHEIAEKLQRSFLPQRMPDLHDVTFAGRYLPGGSGTEIGGDWYDVIPLSGGEVAVGIGDVIGRGISAATLMGQLRNAVRAYALEGHPPARLLDRLSALVHTFHRNQMATFLYLTFDPETATVRFANAGHLPPLLREPDGSTSYLAGDGGSTPLGVVAHTSYEESEPVVLKPGAALLLYTDGLVEERGSAIEEGLERLARAATGAPGDPEGLCEHVLRELLPGGPGGDDVALVSLRRELEHSRLALKVPADPSALASIRRALGRWLQETGADGGEAYEITVACGEACANAIEHAYSPQEARFEVEAVLDGDEVTIAVRDFGGWRDPRGAHRGRGLPMMEALMDSVDVAAGDDGTTVRLRRRLGREERAAA